jgi:hypothetical protein
MQGVPVVQISLSPQTLKDLSLIIAGQLEQYEKDWGTIETAYTRKPK